MLHLSERKRCYRVLAALFAYPDHDLVKLLATGEAAALSDALSQLEAPPALASGNLLEELQIAFTSLFINRLGGAPAPPYGSVYLEEDGRLSGPSTRQVAEVYRQAGLVVEGSGEPPDYLATELEYLYFLVEQEERAFRDRDLEAARAATSKQWDFCEQFLHPWVGEFCRRVREDDQAHILYRWGVAVLEWFCADEASWLARVGR